MTQAASSSLQEGLYERAFQDLVPLHVSVELTQDCNLRCLPCYNFDRRKPRRSGAPPRLAFGEILRLLDDLRTAGTLFLSLTGGEPMVHPRFWDILEVAAVRRFAVQIQTNGTLIDREALRRLSRLPNLLRMSLTLYGATPRTHDFITGEGGSFHRTMQAIRRIKERQVSASLKFLLLRSNAHEAADMVALARREGLPYLVDPAISPRYDGTAGNLVHRLDPEALEPLYRGPLRPFLTRGAPYPPENDFRCACARANAAVSASGEVWPCIAAPLTAGNIRRRRFPEIWKESPTFRKIRGLRLSDFRTCAPCRLKAWCGRIPGNALLSGGDYTGVDPWTCREADIIRRILG